MSYTPFPSGQQVMASSAGVVIASNQSPVSVTGTVGSSIIGQLPAGIQTIGSVAVLQATNPWVINMPSPSVVAVHLAASVTAIRTDNASVIAVLSLSSVAVLQGTNPWVVNVPTPSYLSIQPGGSVMNVNVSGSVAAAITNFSTSIAANINVISASIMVNQGTNPWVIGSIVGTYAEDAVATSGDKGLFVMGVRNDTMSSMTSADGDYSSHVVGPAGEMITANSPITKWVTGNACILTGTSIQVIAAPGASIFTYITGVYVMNDSANAARVAITQGLGRVPVSMLTWAVAPATGGSNMTFPNPLRVLDNNGISASISAVASVYVTITGFTSKT